jgi:hypothetical protein
VAVFFSGHGVEIEGGNFSFPATRRRSAVAMASPSCVHRGK